MREPGRDPDGLAGDGQAALSVDELLPHSAWVRRLARSLVAGDDLAEDVVQQTWVAALARGPRDPGALRGWLRSVIRNVAHKVRRGERRRRERERTHSRPEQLPSTTELVERAELHEHVSRAVRELPASFQRVILLRYYEDMTPQEIASNEGIPAATVRTRLKRGLDRLRERFDAEHGGDRRAWCGALAGLAGLTSTASGALVAPAFLGLPAVGVSLAAAAVLAMAVWSLGKPWSPDVFPVEVVALGEIRTEPTPAGREPEPTVAPALADSGEFNLREDLEFSGAGVIRLRMVDVDTGEPVPDLRFLVTRESPYQHTLGRGRADAEGEVVLRQLPTGHTVLIETERRVPYASAMAAVWLDADADVSVELPVGRGGVVRGRVVDDLGNPVRDCAVRIHTGGGPRVWADEPEQKDRWKYETIADTRTDGRGEYVLAAVISCPDGVWATADHRPQPQAWRPVSVACVMDGVERGPPDRQVGAGDNVQLDDVVLPRAAQWHGVVVDSAGEPVPDVVVSSKGIDGRIDPDQVPDAGAHHPGWHCRTDAAGRFRLVGDPERHRATLRAGDGAKTHQKLPRLAAGEVRTSVRLVLLDTTILHLELVDENGATVGVHAGGAGRWFTVTAQCVDGSTAKVGESLRDGPIRVQLSCRDQSVQSLRVDTPGYESATVEYAGRLRSGDHQRVVLEARPRLLLALDLDPRYRSSAPNDATLRLTPCVISTRRKEQLQQPQGCCRLGRSQLHGLSELPDAVELYVQRPESYWVTVVLSVHRAGEWFEAAHEYGPFRPGDERHVIEVRPEDLWINDLPKVDSPAAVRPEPSLPEEEPRRLITAVALDAETRQVIPDALLAWQGLEEGPSWTWSSRSRDAADAELEARPEPGRWRMRVTAPDYASSREWIVDVGLDDVTDLGSVALRPLPRRSGRILDADGVPLAGARISGIWHGDAGELSRVLTHTGADGSFELRSPAVEVVCVELPGTSHRRTTRQTLPAPKPWPEAAVLRLAPWLRVQIDVTGIDARDAFHLYLTGGSELESQYARKPANVYMWPLGSHVHAAKATTPEGVRTYQFRLPAGHYRVVSTGVLYSLPEVEFEVGAGDDDRRIPVPAKRNW